MKNLYCCCYYSDDSFEEYFGHVYADKFILDEKYEEAFFYDSNNNIIAIIPNVNRVNLVNNTHKFV